MSKKNDNDNIETINLTPRKGVIDLSFFDDLTDQLKFKTEICETTRDFVKDALEDAVSRSDIGHVDLSMQDASEFEDGLESDDNRLNGVVYSGEDDKYTYFVSVMMGYDDEMGEDEEEDYSDFEAMLDDDYDDEGYDEDVVDAPDSTCVCLIRSEKENKTVCQQFDFEKEEWVHLDYEDFTGLTSDQVSILSAGDDPVKSNILMMYRNEYGNIDDKDFNKFCDDNKAIIELFRRADRFTYLTVFDKHKLVLLPNSNYDGGMVTYEDGFYCLCSSFLCEPLKKVYKTKNIDDILLTMANIFDKCFYEDTIAVVPLSDLAFAVFRGSGNIEIFFQNTGKERSEMTAQEQADFEGMMEHSGVVDRIDEKLIDAASAVSGCGPAYAYMFIEALADGGVKCGLPRAKAIRYAAQVLLGSAEMVLQSGKHPELLKDEVCSPGGSTIAGVAALEEHGFRCACIDAVDAAYEKTKKLG